jgi:hypothetical protein
MAVPPLSLRERFGEEILHRLPRPPISLGVVNDAMFIVVGRVVGEAVDGATVGISG